MTKQRKDKRVCTLRKKRIRAKDQQHPQMWVYTHKWVEMHNTIERLEREVLYWRIEAETDHNRWIRQMEENEKLRNAKT